MYNIKIICNISQPDNLTKQNKSEFISPLYITKPELVNILHRIITALPSKYFTNYSKGITNSIKQYIVKEYILFQSQEDIASEEFTENLISFIYELASKIGYALENSDVTLLGK